MSTTASPPPSSPEPPPPTRSIEAEPPTDINTTALPAVLSWKTAEGTTSQHLSDTQLNLHHHVQSNQAFFKLRTSINLKAVSPRTRRSPVYIFIRPEHVQCLNLDEDVRQEAAIESDAPLQNTLSKALGPVADRVCLSFTLTTAPAVVVPRLPLDTQGKASGLVLDQLRALTHQLQVTIHAKIPTRTLSRSRLRSLCDLASGHGLQSIADQAEVHRLYAGQGGKLLEGDEASPAGEEKSMGIRDIPAGESPPSYDELGPSPAPPMNQSGTHTGKRRRVASSPSPPQQPDRKYIKEVVASVLQGPLAQLRNDITSKLDQLRTDLVEHIDQRVEERVEERFVEVREELRQDMVEIFDEECVIGVKEELRDFVDEEVEQAREGILDSISNARISFNLG